MMKTTPGRAWAYVGTVSGVSVSSAANLVETLTNPAVPNQWAKVAAVFMGLLPVGLFVALEVLVRNVIKHHLAWWRVGMGIAALSFAVPSYLHMHWLLLDWGQGVAISLITPFGWDAVMLLSTLALLLPPEALLEIELPPEPEPHAKTPPVVPEPTVTAKPPTAKQKRDGKRLARPQDHPLHGEWLRRRATAQPLRAAELAEHEGSTQPAARSRLNRWEKALDNSDPQPEVESSDREDAFV